MNWEMLLTIIGAFGGLELIRFFAYRKTNGRVEEARADDAELDVLIKHQEFSDRQLAEKDKQLAEKDNQIAEKDREIQEWEQRYQDSVNRYDGQTERLRTTQDSLLDANNQLLTANKRIASLELKYQHAHLWECQTGSCRKRVPSNPLLWGATYTPPPETEDVCE